MTTKNRKHLETSSFLALRDLEYAISCAIQLLSELDRARSQVRTLKGDEDGRMIVSPGNALALNAAVENAALSCREICNERRIEK